MYDKIRTGIIDRYRVHDERIVLNSDKSVLRRTTGRRVSENTRRGYSSEKGTNTASDKGYFGRQDTFKASPAIHKETSEISKEPTAKINSQRSHALISRLSTVPVTQLYPTGKRRFSLTPLI